MARILGASLLAAVLVAGCGAVPTQQPSASPSISASPTLVPTAAASVRGSAEPTPGPTITATCDQGPITVAEFVASDARCYDTADVSVQGWWDIRRDDDSFAGANLDRVLRGSIPFGPWREQPQDFVLVDVEAVPVAGWNAGAHWATVIGRRSQANDRACYREPGADIQAAPRCPSYLVASRIAESEPPASALAGCASVPVDEDGSVAVESFSAYPPACFGSRNVTVRGWFDILYIITGWEDSWGIVPGWLWVPIGPWTVVAPDSNPTTSRTLIVYEDPARKIDVSRTNRWVLLTGHYADPKAATCHVEYSGGYDPARDGARIPDSFARRQCEGHFVVTSIVETP